MDAKKIRRGAGMVWSFKKGQMISLQVHLGDRLGLFRMMAYKLNSKVE